jgi:hypothetical protein
MNFYKLEHTIDENKIGKYPQVSEGKYSCNINDPLFIDRIFFEKAKLKPITAKGILAKDATITDLLSTSGMGFILKLLMSEKLRNILIQHRQTGIEFFNSPVIFKGEELKEFWIMNVFETDEKHIDFSNSDVLIRARKTEGGTKLLKVKISSLEEFKTNIKFHKKNGNYIFLKEVVLKTNVNDDFLIIRNVEGGVGYYVSDRLKKAIEVENITGLEFKQINYE